MKKANMNEMLGAGKSNVRFVEGEVVPAKSRRGFLPCHAIVRFAGAAFAALAAGALQASVTFSDNTGAVKPVEGVVTLGAGGKITYSGDSTLDPVVNATADLTIDNPDNPNKIEYPCTTLFPRGESATPLIIFKNRSLADYDPYQSTLDSTVPEDKKKMIGTGLVFAYHITRASDNSWVTAQMQGHKEGKVIKIKLTQEGSDIGVRVLYSKYFKSGDKTGDDFDKSGKGTSWTYNLDSLVMVRRVKDALAVTNAVTSTSLVLPLSAAIDVVGTNALVSKWAYYSTPIALSGSFCVKDRDVMNISSTLTGTGGSMTFTSTDDPIETWEIAGEDNAQVPYCEWTVMAENMHLSCLTNFTSSMNGGWIGKILTDTYTYNFHNNGKTAGCYIGQGYANRVLRMEFRQNGANVEFMQSYAWYPGNGKPDTKYYDYDSDPLKIGVGAGSNYRSVNWKAAFRSADYVGYDCVATDNKKGEIRFTGTEERPLMVNIGATNVVPANGMLQVGPHAEAWQGIYGKLIDNGESIVYVTTNSTLHLTAGSCLTRDGSCKLIIDKGSVDYSATDGSSRYLQFVTFKNGARIYGKCALSVGYWTSPTYTVSGDEPSTCDSDISLVGTSSYKHFTLNVAETGNGEAADFILNGGVSGETTYTKKPNFTKTGSGTLLFNGAYRAPLSPIVISGGTFAAGETASFTTAVAMQLKGGNFSVATNATIGVLTLSADGAISVGANAELSFADSSAETWVAGKTLTVTLGEGAKLRFGTSADAITADQLAQIKFVEAGRQKLRTAVIDADGYVTAKPRKGLCIMLR